MPSVPSRRARPLGAMAVMFLAVACGTSTRATTADSGESDASAKSAPEEENKVPEGRTPASELAPAGLAHTQVLRIDQDFHPNDDYEIAVDAWVDDAKPDELLEVRMWWMDAARHNERSVFGKGVRRHIDIAYERTSPRAWAVSIVQGGRRFTFDVELSDAAVVEAYADVETEEGVVTQHVLVAQSTLVARKLLGLPIGLERLDIEGRDASGAKIAGHLQAVETD